MFMMLHEAELIFVAIIHLAASGSLSYRAQKFPDNPLSEMSRGQDALKASREQADRMRRDGVPADEAQARIGSPRRPQGVS